MSKVTKVKNSVTSISAAKRRAQAAERQRRYRERRRMQEQGYRVLRDAAIAREAVGALVAVGAMPSEVQEDDERLAYELGRLVNRIAELAMQHPNLAEALREWL